MDHSNAAGVGAAACRLDLLCESGRTEWPGAAPAGMASSSLFSHQACRVPYECLSREFRKSQKSTERAIGEIEGALQQLQHGAGIAPEIERLLAKVESARSEVCVHALACARAGVRRW